MATNGFDKRPQDINKGGRPVGSGGFSITTLVKKKLQELPEGEDEKTYASIFIQTILDKAIKDNDVQMQKTIWAYMDGLPKQAVEGELNVNVSYGWGKNKKDNSV